MGSESIEPSISLSRDTSSRILAAFAPLPYQSLNASGEITEVNAAWLETFGYEREAVIGEQFEKFHSPPSAEKFRRVFATFKADGSISDVEFEMHRADGSTMFVSFHGIIEYDGDGEFRSTHCQLRDVTEQRTTERRLRQQRDRFRALTGAIPDIVILYDADGTYEELLTGQEQLLVADQAELVGKSIEETVNAAAATTIQSAIDRTLRREEITTSEYRLTIDGESKWFEGRFAPVTGADSEKVVLTARDITDRKEQQAELRETSERLELAIEGANLGVWDWDMETDAVSRHAKLREMLGYSRTEFGGHLRDWEQLVHPEGKTRHETAFEEHIAENTEYYECDYRLQAKDGDWKWIRNIGKVVAWGPDGSPKRAVGIHIDIDDQKRAMEELAKKSDQLEALNRVVRHDIRNDINIIHGWAKALEDHVDDDGEKALERVIEGSKHVIDITKAAREFVDSLGGDETVDIEPVHLSSHLRKEVQTQRETYPEASIEIAGELPDLRVEANEMVSSVFRNLLVNAIQHNNSAEPAVTIEVTAGPNDVVISFADNGPGIPDERKEAVFGKGEKGLESEGTGIGLHLVHSLVAGYDGEVWIEDNQPGGSKFFVELPRAN